MITRRRAETPADGVTQTCHQSLLSKFRVIVCSDIITMGTLNFPRAQLTYCCYSGTTQETSQLHPRFVLRSNTSTSRKPAIHSEPYPALFTDLGCCLARLCQDLGSSIKHEDILQYPFQAYPDTTHVHVPSKSIHTSAQNTDAYTSGNVSAKSTASFCSRIYASPGSIGASCVFNHAAVQATQPDWPLWGSCKDSKVHLTM